MRPGGEELAFANPGEQGMIMTVGERRASAPLAGFSINQHLPDARNETIHRRRKLAAMDDKMEGLKTLLTGARDDRQSSAMTSLHSLWDRAQPGVQD